MIIRVSLFDVVFDVLFIEVCFFRVFFFMFSDLWVAVAAKLCKCKIQKLAEANMSKMAWFEKTLQDRC